MVYADLRSWLSKLDIEKDLWRIKSARPEPDIGAIGRAICDVQGPAALIEHVDGYGTPVAIGIHAAWRRVALAMGLPKNSAHEEITEAWRRAFSKGPTKCRYRSDGPCKETIIKDKINLFQFPLHRINFSDGSFYISKGCVITRDPDTQITNVGIYRMMALDRDRTAMMINFRQHGAEHFMRQEEKGKPLEVAVSIGNEPVLPMVAGARIPYGWSELEFSSTIRDEPYELVHAENVDIDVPANAEIVLEGFLYPEKRVLEGPFGEFTGAYTGFFYAPVFQVTCMTHRESPIFESLYIGHPNAEPQYMTMHSKLAGVFYELKQIMPNITRISYLKPYVHVVVIQGRWVHTSDPKRAIHALWGSTFGNQAKVTICVDEDVDVWDAEEVLWAVSTRVASPDDLLISPGTFVGLDPASRDGMSVKLGIDATKPRLPFYRYGPVDWVERPLGTKDWVEKLMRWKAEKGRSTQAAN